MNPITVDACRALAVIGVRTGSTSTETQSDRSVAVGDRRTRWPSTETGSSSLGANRLALVTVTICDGKIVHVADSPGDRVPPSLLERSRTWRS